ncbi:Intradiol ring-cleavage dioxygenase [Abortiporus biennis]|nr:Intradiol ring-cleavage dioxygenase [Abortiporus biennis]
MPSPSDLKQNPLVVVLSDQQVPLLVLFLSIIRDILMQLTFDNVFLWQTINGCKKNPRADIEGPFYLVGSPNRNLPGHPGMAIFASLNDLKNPGANLYAFNLTILSPLGRPLPNTLVDLWQADEQGKYSFTSYYLRGKCTTDENGNVRILSPLPGKYGLFGGIERASHFHLMISPAKENVEEVKEVKEKESLDFVAMARRIEPLTTQVYICPGNEKKWLEADVLGSSILPPRYQNMLTSYAAGPQDPLDDFSFPSLAASSTPDQEELSKTVEMWNEYLGEQGLGGVNGKATVKAAGKTTIMLNWA